MFSLKNGFDGIAAFVPCGLTAFRVAFKSFVQSNPSGIVMVADENSQNRIYDEIDVKHMVFEALNMLVRYGVKNIGMNGIRIKGNSEQIIMNVCCEWLKKYGDENNEVSITLVDLRNSFRSWAKTEVKVIV